MIVEPGVISGLTGETLPVKAAVSGTRPRIGGVVAP